MNYIVQKIQPEVLYGIAGALLYIFSTTLLYLISITVFMDPLLRTIIYVSILSIPILAALEKRRRNGGTLTYIEALGSVFSTFLIIEVLWSVFYFTLFNYIDPNLGENIKHEQIAYIDRGDFERTIELEEYLEGLQEQDFVFSARTAIDNILAYSILGLIIALISAVFIKREDHSGLSRLE